MVLMRMRIRPHCTIDLRVLARHILNWKGECVASCLPKTSSRSQGNGGPVLSDEELLDLRQHWTSQIKK